MESAHRDLQNLHHSPESIFRFEKTILACAQRFYRYLNAVHALAYVGADIRLKDNATVRFRGTDRLLQRRSEREMRLHCD